MFDTFIKIEGCDGESSDDKHKGWIELFSFSHGVAQTGAGAISSAGGRTAGKCDHHDFVITKRLDKSSPNLYKFACNGKHLTKATVELCKATGNKETFMKYTLENVLVSSINIGGGQGQETPVETVSLNYGKIKWEYTELDGKTGSKKGNVVAEHDVLSNKTV